MRLVNLAAANNYLARFYENARTEYKLDNMRQLMDYLNNPQDKFKVVHIAGTSGKTSTAYYMSALLTAGGKKTGLTVSPHVDELNERVQINGQPVPEKDFCQAFTTFLEIIEAGPVRPSWFEVMVAFSYWYFAREEVDYAVVEVGLGGLKDGTNVITRPDKVCVITDIGLDHINVLGRSLGEIAAQKAGIIQPDNQVFTYRQPPAVMKAFESRCREQGARLHIVQGSTARTGLPGFQQRNWGLATAVYEFLTVRDSLPTLNSKDVSGTMQVRIPGRMETIKSDKTVEGKTLVMDGAHNMQKMTALLGSFRELYPGVKPAVLISLKEGKEYKELAPLLEPLASRVIVTTYEASQDTPTKSMDPKVLAAAFATVPVEIIENPQTAFRALLKSASSVCLVTGSFYLLSQIRNNNLI